MTDINYNQTIRKANEDLKLVKDRIEALVPEFKKAASDCLLNWSSLIIERAIADHPSRIKELDSRKLEKMKAEFKQVVNTYPSLCTSKMEEAWIWLHRDNTSLEGTTNLTSLHFLQKRADELIDEALKILIGEVGNILVNYGLLRAGESQFWIIEKGKPPRYSYPIPFNLIDGNGTFNQLKERYSQILSECVTPAKCLRDAKQEKEIAEAKELWNKG